VDGSTKTSHDLALGSERCNPGVGLGSCFVGVDGSVLVWSAMAGSVARCFFSHSDAYSTCAKDYLECGSRH